MNIRVNITDDPQYTKRKESFLMSESCTHTLSQMFNSAHSGASFLRICAFLKPADGNKLFPCVSLANVLYALFPSVLQVNSLVSIGGKK